MPKVPELAMEMGHCDLATLAIPVSAAAVTSLFNQKYDAMFLKLFLLRVKLSFQMSESACGGEVR